jgi:uncharacterized protein YjbJ (UPF0337 family)
MNDDKINDRTDRENATANQVEGQWKQFKGAAKEVASNVTHDPQDRLGGMADRASGKLQEGLGKAQEKVADLKDDLARR